MRLIDADALMGVVTKNSYILRSEHNTTDYGMFLSGIKQAVDEAPAIDAMPVVYCKDCIHFERQPDTEDLEDFGKCLEGRGEDTKAGSMVFWPDEMYCDYGER